MISDLESLSNLGVEGIDTGPFGSCPICAHGPEGRKIMKRQEILPVIQV